MAPRRADKPIWFQDHARARMRQRGISDEMVVNVIRNPDREVPASRRDAIRFEKATSKRNRMVVIAKETSSDFWVITAYRNS